MKLDASDSDSRSINALGVIAGVLMIMLPFLGPWWIGMAGDGALEVALSPFNMSISIFGQPVTSDLIGLFLLAEMIAMIIAGAFMILASISTKSWWSGRVFRFGVMKPFWAVVGLVALFVVGAFIMNNVLPALLSNMVSGAGASVQIKVPYVVGTAYSTIQAGSALVITAPIKFSLTPIFWVAVATTALCIMARIYHRRYIKKPEVK